jgi:hypothetical protein
MEYFSAIKELPHKNVAIMRAIEAGIKSNIAEE